MVQKLPGREPLSYYPRGGLQRLSTWRAQNPHSSITRAGVIPYAVVGRMIHFCLGVDVGSGDLTDFGGGYSPRRDVDPVAAALRELREESQFIFDVNFDHIGDGWFVESKTDLILFLRCDTRAALESCSLFARKVRRATKPEVRAIVWLSQVEFALEMERSSVYFKVRDLIGSHTAQIVRELTYEVYEGCYQR